MAQYFKIHSTHPQQRLIEQAVAILSDGGVVALPTDSSYAVACNINDKHALDKIRRMRQLSDKHNFTLLCKSLTQVSNFTKMDNDAYRLIKKLSPGPFTFLLSATKEVPKRLQHPKKKTIGIRIPDNAVAQQVLETLGQPLFSSTLIRPEATAAETEPSEINSKLAHLLDLIIDSGIIESRETTIIDCYTDNTIKIQRQGIGRVPMLDNPNE